MKGLGGVVALGNGRAKQSTTKQARNVRALSCLGFRERQACTRPSIRSSRRTKCSGAHDPHFAPPRAHDDGVATNDQPQLTSTPRPSLLNATGRSVNVSCARVRWSSAESAVRRLFLCPAASSLARTPRLRPRPRGLSRKSARLPGIDRRPRRFCQRFCEGRAHGL